MKVKPVKVTFKAHEEYLERYVRSKGDYSNYVKDLIKRDYESNKKEGNLWSR